MGSHHESRAIEQFGVSLQNPLATSAAFYSASLNVSRSDGLLCTTHTGKYPKSCAFSFVAESKGSKVPE